MVMAITGLASRHFSSEFPNAKAVATPNAVRVMRQNASPEALEGVWKVSFPGQIPDRLVIAEELDGHRHRSRRT